MDIDSLKLVRQLAQARPSGTSAVSILNKVVARRVVITSIIVTNTTASSANYSIFLDKDGTTYDQTTALFYAVPLTGNSTTIIEFVEGLPIDPTAAGNLAVQTGTGSAFTFTVNGIEL